MLPNSTQTQPVIPNVGEILSTPSVGVARVLYVEDVSDGGSTTLHSVTARKEVVTAARYCDDWGHLSRACSPYRSMSWQKLIAQGI